jgi:SAM-dependent methyltransferase
MSEFRLDSIARTLRRWIARSPAQLRLRDLVLDVGRRKLFVYREDLARRYLRGSGIEIGAMALPMRVPPSVQVHQLDRMSRAELIESEGPAMRGVGADPEHIVEIDIVDDAATLAKVSDASVHFVVANHVLEHLEDPIGALQNMIRVLRPGGTLLLTLPDPAHSFDARRPPTSVAHLLADHEHGPEVSRAAHYREWAQLIEGVPADRVDARAAEFAEQDARHHFHVWRLSDFLTLLLAIDLPAEVIHAQSYLKEFAVVMRRGGTTRP